MHNPLGSLTQRIKDHLILGLLTAGVFFSLLHGLGEVPPYHTDENFYVLTAKNMLQTGDYVTPMYHDEKRFAKPILFYWLVALAYKVFGISLSAARLWPVLFGTLCVPLTFYLARRLFAREAALISAFLLPACFMHFQIARWATTDMALSFFILCALFFFVRAYQQETWRAANLYLFYLSMAVGFLIKGPPAILIPALVVLAFLLLRRDGNMLRQMRLGTGIVLMLFVDAPWFVAMAALHGEEFINHILGPEIKDRIFHQVPFSAYYFGVLLRYYLPWSLFLIFSLGFYFRNTSWRERNRPAETETAEAAASQPYAPLLCALWIAVPLLMFTVFRIEHSRYLLPASPAIVMLLAHFWVALMQSPRGFRSAVFQIPFYLTLCLYLLITVALGAAVILFNSFQPVPFNVHFTPLFLATGIVVVFVMHLFRKKTPLILTLATLQILTFGLIHGEALPYFNRYPMKTFASTIQQSAEGSERIGVYRLGSHQARIGVLTGHPAKYIFTPEDLRDFLNTEDTVYLVMRDEDWQSQFHELSLQLQTSDSIWKKRRVKWQELKEMWQKKLDLQSPDFVETVHLFTNR